MHYMWLHGPHSNGAHCPHIIILGLVGEMATNKYT
jgi:hypothetical protein